MWGSVAEWFSAIGAVGALVAAILAVIASKRLYQIESDRDATAAARHEQEQANGIAAWCVSTVVGGDRGLQIHNSSDSPVFDVQVHSTYAARQDHRPERKPVLKLSVLPPGDFVATEHETYHWNFPVGVGELPGGVRPITKNLNWVVTSIYFTDASGVAWERRTGRLIRLS